MIEFLPCPFCGKHPKNSFSPSKEEGDPSAYCFECPDGCSVSKEAPTYEDAKRLWNTRFAVPDDLSDGFSRRALAQKIAAMGSGVDTDPAIPVYDWQWKKGYKQACSDIVVALSHS